MTDISPRKALNKAFLKIKPQRSEIEKFKSEMIRMLDDSETSESEEYHKNLLGDFLKRTYYDPAHFINTDKRKDLVIHVGNSKSDIGVIIETKKESNSSEMITRERLNAKAMQELLLYYLRERILNKNLNLKHLIITNFHEWFIFDAQEFEKHFGSNTSLAKTFHAFEEERLSGKSTDFFYKEIAKPIIAKVEKEIVYTYFNLDDYNKVIRNENKADDSKLVVLYKLLSPEHILKQAFTNDSNSLDKKFYAELLHIIGLAEVKEKGKKVIERPKAGERNTGALLENAIIQIDSLDKLSRIKNASQYGISKEEKEFNVGLELVITWINRVLFLKLLEAQLISYNKGDQSYAFLNYKRLDDFDEINKLFFQVLAKTKADRRPEIEATFTKVPYLNSSLFDPTELEHDAIAISNLVNDKTVPVHPGTVLRDANGKKLKGELNTLEYLLSFLDAYDFSSQGAETIQEENKSLINASVLGLIFEKINGYKDGSFFTPGFVTMYMCRETIRRSVVQKFNDSKGWNCKTLDDLYDKIEDRIEANTIINDLKICDPAVGSGHFLVSALNEIIAIKHDLKILSDKEGRRLKEYAFEVVNDELVITDEEDQLLDYNPKNKESQRIQETLFHEKQTIIENCLFGVDINPNSVKICRLRLWIELLKHAYYRPDGELETLPNIDINIKCGNSLISRFDLDADIKQALRTSGKSIKDYQLYVQTYRQAKSKEEKRELMSLIDAMKSSFRSIINTQDPIIKKLAKARGELFNLTDAPDLFGASDVKTAKWKKKVQKATDAVTKFEETITEIKNNKIYNNAFEWRFEFPEVLSDEGDFVGFDTVIGNPPYIRQEEFSDHKVYLKDKYQTAAGTADLYVYFVERGMQILKDNGHFVYILPNKWMRAGYGANLRKWISDHTVIAIDDFGDLQVFEEATTYPCLWQMKKTAPIDPLFKATDIKTLDYEVGLSNYISNHQFDVNQSLLSESGWTLVSDQVQNLLQKIKSKGMSLGEYVNGQIYRGILTGLNEAFVIDEETKDRLISEDPKSAELIKPFLGGKDVKRYQNSKVKKWIILFENGQTKLWFGNLSETDAWGQLEQKYRVIANYLIQFEVKAKARTDQGEYWWELRACAYYSIFEGDKITWPETSNGCQFTIVESGIYLNKTTFSINSKEYSLLGLLNSTLSNFYFDKVVSKMRGGYYSMSKAYVETLPVPDLSKIDSSLSKLVVQLLESDNNVSLELEIDKLIYGLYDLTPEQINLIESSLSI